VTPRPSGSAGIGVIRPSAVNWGVLRGILWWILVWCLLNQHVQWSHNQTNNSPNHNALVLTPHASQVNVVRFKRNALHNPRWHQVVRALTVILCCPQRPILANVNVLGLGLPPQQARHVPHVVCVV